MTILQLKYVITISKYSSMREAASRLYVSQPALSASIRELEEEIGLKLFERNNRGISLSQDGLEFLSYAKQAVSQYEIIEFSSPQYTFSVHETRTDEVLGNVRELKSEIGIVSYSSKNENIMKKLFREYQLDFFPLMQRDTYIYVWKDHPLASCTEISLEELKEYPCVVFEQSSENDLYLNEEALSDYDFDKIVKTNDRATSLEIVAGLNGYSVGTGTLSKSAALTDGLVCIKLKEEDPLTIGYIVRKGYSLSTVGEEYIEELNKYKEL